MAYAVRLYKLKERLQIHLKAPLPAVTEGADVSDSAIFS